MKRDRYILYINHRMPERTNLDGTPYFCPPDEWILRAIESETGRVPHYFVVSDDTPFIGVDLYPDEVESLQAKLHYCTLLPFRYGVPRNNPYATANALKFWVDPLTRLHSLGRRLDPWYKLVVIAVIGCLITERNYVAAINVLSIYGCALLFYLLGDVCTFLEYKLESKGKIAIALLYGVFVIALIIPVLAMYFAIEKQVTTPWVLLVILVHAPVGLNECQVVLRNYSFLRRGKKNKTRYDEEGNVIIHQE
jgi:hypothetical protein